MDTSRIVLSYPKERKEKSVFRRDKLIRSSKKNGNGLKFHNFVASDDQLNIPQNQVLCLKEEHGTKQINVSNWRKEPIDKCVVPNQNPQSILESLLAKQSMSTSCKSNRRKPLHVRRVLRQEISEIDQSEPLDLCTRKRHQSSSPHPHIESQEQASLIHLKSHSDYSRCKPRIAQRSVIKQKLEDAFRSNGFLVKTKQVSDGDATFCKFRQLRKYTRYYLKSWHQHLPEEVNKLWKGFLPPKTKTNSSQ